MMSILNRLFSELPTLNIFKMYTSHIKLFTIKKLIIELYITFFQEKKSGKYNSNIAVISS